MKDRSTVVERLKGIEGCSRTKFLVEVISIEEGDTSSVKTRIPSNKSGETEF